MERKILLIPLALLALSIIMPMAKADSAPFLEAQMTITSWVEIKNGHYLEFEGVVDGPNVVAGIIEGAGTVVAGEIDVDGTITDKDGDIIIFHLTGWEYPGNPSGAYYPWEYAEAKVTKATGKYFDLRHVTFIVEGYCTVWQTHMKWYYP